MADPASVYRQGNSSPHMDELLINRRYWYYRLRCPRQPAATSARRHFLRHKSLLPATPLDIQLRPELHTGGIVMELCTVDFFGGEGVDPICATDQSVYLDRGVEKVSFLCACC